MINIGEIDKKNLVQEPFEHMVIDFIDPTFIVGEFDKFCEEHTVITNHEHFYTVSQHPIEKILVHYYPMLIEKVNRIWDCGVTNICMSTSKFDADSKLIKHNDFHEEESIPVRGILYLNNVNEFGTTIHDGDNETIVGGNPGQLFLFRISEKSWHSAGNEPHRKQGNRYTSNWIFTR